MNKVYNSFSELVGNTPIIKLCNLKNIMGLNAQIYAKLEFFNPCGSVKDRIALKMIEDAEKSGTLKQGGTVIEPTSGNTGIGLAAVCATKGYKAIIVMPETMSVERQKLIKAYGAEIVLTEGKKGMSGAIEKAEELNKQIDGSIIAGQFENSSNPKTHFETTGPEIYEALNGEIDCFVAGVGSGGTLSGTGEFLKQKNENIKVIAVEPERSPVLSKGISGAHGIQGIGAGFVPQNLNTKIYDEVLAVSDEEAMEFARMLCKSEGLCVGISSGAALCAAVKLAKRKEFLGKNIVIVLPDSGNRYLSTELFK